MFGFFHKILWKNLNELLGDPNIYIYIYIYIFVCIVLEMEMLLMRDEPRKDRGDQLMRGLESHVKESELCPKGTREP